MNIRKVIEVPRDHNGDPIGPAAYDVESSSVQSTVDWLLEHKMSFSLTFQEGNSARIFIDPVDEARMDWFASDEPGFWLICKHDPERNGDYKQAFLESFKSKEVAFEEQCELWDDIHDRIGESAAGRAVEFEIITHEQALEKYGAETLAQAREEKSISDIFDQLADMHSDFPLDSSKEYIEAAFSVPIKEAVAA